MRVVYQYFPHTFYKWRYPNFDHEESPLCKRVPGEPGWCMDEYATLRNPNLILAICEYLDLPKRYAIFFSVKYMRESDGNADVGLSIGTNYQGMVDDQARDDLKALFSLDEDPKWFLDPVKWKWRRVHPSKLGERGLCIFKSLSSGSRSCSPDGAVFAVVEFVQVTQCLSPLA